MPQHIILKQRSREGGCQNARQILGLKSTVRLQWTKGHDPPETQTCTGCEGKGVGCSQELHKPNTSHET